jgi:hypothetical protein
VKDGRHAEAGLASQELLYGSAGFRGRDGWQIAPARDPGDLPDAVREPLPKLSRRKHTVLEQIDDRDGTDLGNLFVQGHLRKEFRTGHGSHVVAFLPGSCAVKKPLIFSQVERFNAT